MQHIKKVALDVLQALDFLRTKGTVHRNLRPENLLIDSESKLVKLTDFGYSRSFVVKPSTYTPLPARTKPASQIHMDRVKYKAPEIITRSSKYGIEVDVWSLGCIVSEMALGETLFKGNNEYEILLDTFSLLGVPEWLADKKLYPRWQPISMTLYSGLLPGDREKVCGIMAKTRGRSLKKIEALFK